MALQSFDDVDFTGFDEDTIEKIKADCLRFTHFKLALNRTSFSIDGSVFGTPSEYYVNSIKNGMDIRVYPKSKQRYYDYGILVFEEDSMTKFLVYHNAH